MHPIFSDPQLRDTLAQVASETNRSPADVQAEAEACLEEIAARRSNLTVAAWDRFCHWLARAYKVDADDDALDRLQVLSEGHSLIFLPNHRSYLDPMVLRSAMLRHGFPANFVLGGSNLAIWPLASIGQHSGIVFIRRQFRDAPVYRAVLREYLSYLLNQHANLEWYIEGGRTRTGKLRPPRYGILSYVIDAFSKHPDRDVHIIPTSIIYDQQHEVGAISAEEMGGTKAPETLGWLYRFSRSQSRRLGRAHIRFGEPLSLRDALAATEADGEVKPRLAVSKVAFEVCNRINLATPVTPTALVTFALLDNDDRAITVHEGRQILRPLMEYMDARKLPMTARVDLSHESALADSLRTLVREGVVTMFDGGTHPVFVIPREEQHEAAFYRNTIIHFFVNRAIAEVALMQACREQSPDVPGDTWRNAKRLRDLLKFEFFFPTTLQFAKEIEAEVSLINPQWQSVEVTAESAMADLRGLGLYLAHRVIAPFFEAYDVVADQLAAADPSRPVDENTLIERCFGIAQQRWLQHQMHSPESISRDLFRNALKLADNRGLIEQGGKDLARRRKAFADEIAAASGHIALIRGLSRQTASRDLTPEPEVP